MGDRANIYLVDSKDETRGLYFYTHWAGADWPEELRKALDSGRGRWGDGAYLSRYIASQVFADLDGLTGGGIATWLPDNEHLIIVVDHENKEVSFAHEGEESDRSRWMHTKSFEAYVSGGVASYPGEE